MMHAKYLVTVVGPTAIGKTSLAIEVANALHAEIISADSRQFFKEMSIGTAVPTPEELSMTPHHFIQHKSVHDPYSVGAFEKEALVKIDSLFENHDFVVMVGGSGLYIDAVLKGFDEFPDVTPGVRENLQREYNEKGITFLQEELWRIDPDYASTVDIDNPQRIMRALEVSFSAGRPYSSFLGKRSVERKFMPIVIGIEAPREVIYDRINKRVDQMVDAGLIEEAKLLLEFKSLNALQTVGYRELFEAFEGRTTFESAISEIKKNTRRFAKRQLTWFRRNADIRWFDYTADVSEVLDYIRQRTRP